LRWDRGKNLGLPCVKIKRNFGKTPGSFFMFFIISINLPASFPAPAPKIIFGSPGEKIVRFHQIPDGGRFFPALRPINIRIVF
jgi:hypothetical protein